MTSRNCGRTVEAVLQHVTDQMPLASFEFCHLQWLR